MSSLWFFCDNLTDPNVGQEVILRRVVSRDGQWLYSYLTDPDMRIDDYVMPGNGTSIYYGRRIITKLRKNADGRVSGVMINRY